MKHANPFAGMDRHWVSRETFNAVRDENRHLRNALAARNATCEWKYDDYLNMYEGECGVAWAFTEGNIDDNDCAYCPRCGGRIVNISHTTENDDE